MKKVLIAAMVVSMVAAYTTAAERMPLEDVNTDAFTNDTQVIPAGAGDNHLALAWWIPHEFWESILGAAMGNLGSNMHFFVLNDESESSPRLIDPYLKGHISIQLERRDEVQLDARIEMPLNSLYIPRKCPNGMDAHVSWKFCPWTGKPLEE